MDHISLGMVYSRTPLFRSLFWCAVIFSFSPLLAASPVVDGAIYQQVSKPASRPPRWSGTQPVDILPQEAGGEEKLEKVGSRNTFNASDCMSYSCNQTIPETGTSNINVTKNFSTATSSYVNIISPTVSTLNKTTKNPIITKSINITDSLLTALDAVMKKGVSCFHPKWVNTVSDLRNRRWVDQLHDIPALVYPFCSDSSSLGNWLGLYLNEASCAMLSGGSLISPSIEHGYIPQNTTGRQDLFFDALPRIVLSAAPLEYAEVIRRMGEVCKCPRYCWDDPAAAMFKNTAWISSIVRKSINSYLTSIDMSMGTQINPLIDFSNGPMNSKLPLVPDVAIQYRCGDNMNYGSIGYGILPFRVFSDKIPKDSKYIFVMSDPPNRAGNNPSASHCAEILKWLFEYLKKEYSNSTVVVKKGGDVYLDFARLSMANTTICSASTFCLFPAIAHNGSAVYFPRTKLIGVPPEGYSMNDHFHWVNDPPLVADVFKPWYLIAWTLNGTSISRGSFVCFLVHFPLTPAY